MSSDVKDIKEYDENNKNNRIELKDLKDRKNRVLRVLLKYRINYQIKPIYQEYIKDGMIKREGLDKFNKIVNNIFKDSNL